jgi:hypothetical protein
MNEPSKLTWTTLSSIAEWNRGNLKNVFHIHGWRPIGGSGGGYTARITFAKREPARWIDIVGAERIRLGRPLTLLELLSLAKGYNMTDDEIEAQRQSWARQMMD